MYVRAGRPAFAWPYAGVHMRTSLIKYTGFGVVWFYGISTIVGYLMPNPLHTYIFNIEDLVWFYGISIIVGYLMPNPLYTYIFNI